MHLEQDEMAAKDGKIHRKVVTVCGRCQGTGLPMIAPDAGPCFRCGGAGRIARWRVVESIDRRQRREQKEAERQERAEKARRRAEREQRRAERTAFGVLHYPETLEALAEYTGEDAFLQGMRNKARKKGLTEAQLQAGDRTLRAEARAHRAANAVIAHEATLDDLLDYAGENEFLQQMASKAAHGGDLTDRQLAAAGKALQEEHRAQRAAYAAYHYPWALESLLDYAGSDSFLQKMRAKAAKGGDITARQIAAADKALREERRAQRAAYGVIHYPETLARLLAYEGANPFLAKLARRAREGGDLSEGQLAKAAEQVA